MMILIKADFLCLKNIIKKNVLCILWTNTHFKYNFLWSHLPSGPVLEYAGPEAKNDERGLGPSNAAGEEQEICISKCIKMGNKKLY